MDKILIVESDPFTLDNMVLVLKNAQMDVHSVTTGKGAMAMMLANHYDLLITDLHLEDVNGMDVIDRAISEDDAMKILVSSGGVGCDSSESLLNEAILSGADAVLEKPFREDELVRSAKALLSLHN